MKQKDIALIIVIAAISTGLSFVISGAIVGSPQKKSLNAETVEKVTADFPDPPLPEKYFNNKSTNPTRDIEIDDPNNKTPFDDTSQ